MPWSPSNGLLSFRPGSLLRSHPQEMQTSVTIRIGDEFRKLPNFPQDRKQKCHELKPTDADARSRATLTQRWRAERSLSCVYRARHLSYPSCSDEGQD